MFVRELLDKILHPERYEDHRVDAQRSPEKPDPSQKSAAQLAQENDARSGGLTNQAPQQNTFAYLDTATINTFQKLLDTNNPGTLYDRNIAADMLFWTKKQSAALTPVALA